MEYKAYSQAEPPEIQMEAGGGEKVTESAGYIPADRQIEEMIMAGMRLGDARKEAFDTVEEDDVELDPTRVQGFDMADAHQMQVNAIAKVEADAIAGNKKAGEEKKKKEDEKNNPPKVE